MSEIQVITTVKVDGKKFNSVAEAEAYVSAKAFTARITAWMDAKGMSTGKGNRRASTLATIAEWEADNASGLVDEAVAGVEAAKALAAAAPAEAETEQETAEA